MASAKKFYDLWWRLWAVEARWNLTGLPDLYEHDLQEDVEELIAQLNSRLAPNRRATAPRPRWELQVLEEVML